MALKPKQSAILKRAQKRLDGFKTINSTLDLGDGFSVKSFTQRNHNLSTTLVRHNELQASLDAEKINLRNQEEEMADYLERSLSAVVTKYGKNSDEYAKAGGTKKSQRKRPGQGKKAKAKKEADKAKAAETKVVKDDAKVASESATQPATQPAAPAPVQNGQSNGTAHS